MSEKKKTVQTAQAETAETAAQAGTAAQDPNEELVEYTAPLLGMSKAKYVLCAVNGETIRVKRGETVRIKRKFVKVLQNANEQEKAAWETAEKFQKTQNL